MSQEQLIRLECLKLAHHQGREPAEVIERAAILERFVAGNTPPAKPLGLPKKDAAPAPGKK
jgi:hypothetical protein